MMNISNRINNDELETRLQQLIIESNEIISKGWDALSVEDSERLQVINTEMEQLLEEIN